MTIEQGDFARTSRICCPARETFRQSPRSPPIRGTVKRPSFSEDRAARDLLPDPGRSITSIAKLLGVSPATLYHHIPDLRELRAAQCPASSKPPHSRQIRSRSTSAALSVPQLLTPAYACHAACPGRWIADFEEFTELLSGWAEVAEEAQRRQWGWSESPSEV
ncbi:hypothetical protein [Streptomyces sp. NRRL S-337]|uniref:hypothetical protein n=1 Tax=Streptomyces sp. NRRL S-337 TaxID=1463900 RepID=UPI001F1E0839|nr:hypothetical protein [Streptomyces sp. NRRL S-337]